MTLAELMRPAKQEWTTTPPTMPGTYWIVGYWRGGRPHACEMNEKGEMWNERGGYWEELESYYIPNYGPFYWWGPIQPPELPADLE